MHNVQNHSQKLVLKKATHDECVRTTEQKREVLLVMYSKWSLSKYRCSYLTEEC